VSRHLCNDPECRYKRLYEGAQTSLGDMAARQAETLGRLGRFRQAVVLALKGSFPAAFSQAEAALGQRMVNADDEIVIAYLDGFLASQTAIPKLDTAGIAELRAALAGAGFPVPPGDDLRAWAHAIHARGTVVAPAAPAAAPTPPVVAPAPAPTPPVAQPEDIFTAPGAAATAATRASVLDEMFTAPDHVQVTTPEAQFGSPVGDVPAALDIDALFGEAQPIEPSDSIDDLFAMPTGLSQTAAGTPVTTTATSDLDDLFTTDGPVDTDTSDSIDDLFAMPAGLSPSTAGTPVTTTATSDLDDLFATTAIDDLDAMFDEPTFTEHGFVGDDGPEPPAPSGPAPEDAIDALFGPVATTQATTATAAPAVQVITADAADNDVLDEMFGTTEPVTVKRNGAHAGSEPLRPQLLLTPPTRTNRRKPPRSAKPGELDVPQTTTPVELVDPVRDQLLAAVCVTRPVFTSDLANLVGAEIVTAWEAECRADATSPVRFIPPKGRHRLRGSLVLPVEYAQQSSTEFAASAWAQTLEQYRGAKLYEAAVVLHRVAERVVAHRVNEHTLVLRLNESRGLVGVVLSFDAEISAPARVELTNALEEMMRERLTQIAVLATHTNTLDRITGVLTAEAEIRRWRPLMPVTGGYAWEFADTRGAGTQLLFGN
jgi:hypothetical protein